MILYRRKKSEKGQKPVERIKFSVSLKNIFNLNVHSIEGQSFCQIFPRSWN